MMNVFITGATGYIGGDILSQLLPKHPDLSYRLLVPGKDKGERIKSIYPSVGIVYGGLEDDDVLQGESAKADIIIHTADAADHIGAANAICAGILNGHTADRPAYWIHTSGAGIFSYVDTDEKTYGISREKIYNDWDGVQEIVTIPEHAFHRAVDKVVLEAGAAHPEIIKAAIISPTTVFGLGRGPCSQRSRQVYELARWTLERKRAPIIGEGESRGCGVYITDLTDLYMAMFDAVLSGRTDLWGPEAYYLAETGEYRWSDLAREIALIAQKEGFIPTAETESLEAHIAQEWAGFEAASWGLNVRCRATRARKVLGWNPQGPSLEKELPGIVRGEWKALQGMV
ncbi:NAD(P)-binding protein [Aspergillus ambiguus]|uniref:NAD(P)-binding protein n=1 Tax=Aspergillus ambiguus TaxID=176160 RepID=UPI003CCDFC73